MPSVTIAKVGSVQEAVDVFNRITAAYKATFKRLPSVDLFVSTTFGQTASRRGKQTDAPDQHSITAHLPDPATADHHWDVQWLTKAAAEPTTR